MKLLSSLMLGALGLALVVGAAQAGARGGAPAGAGPRPHHPHHPGPWPRPGGHGHGHVFWRQPVLAGPVVLPPDYAAVAPAPAPIIVQAPAPAPVTIVMAQPPRWFEPKIIVLKPARAHRGPAAPRVHYGRAPRCCDRS